MKILYFGAYDPKYPRNRTLINGLRSVGATVIECNDRSSFGLKYLKLIFKFWRLRKSFDVMVVGFPGQESMILARILTSAPIIFDVFTSHYGGHVLDRETYSPESLRARYYKLIDRVSCRLADRVILDTNAHINFFVNEFGLPTEHFKRIFVGTDSNLFISRPEREGDNFLVHFHGTFVPLQGVDIIVRAASLLKDKPIKFRIIGKGQTYNQVVSLVKELGVEDKIEFLNPVPYSDLPKYVSDSNISLGIFGQTLKTQLVIPNKVFEAMASGRAVITADTPAARELLTNGQNAILCEAGNPRALADAILMLWSDKVLRNGVVLNADILFREKLSERNLGGQLISIAAECLDNSQR